MPEIFAFVVLFTGPRRDFSRQATNDKGFDHTSPSTGRHGQ